MFCAGRADGSAGRVLALTGTYWAGDLASGSPRSAHDRLNGCPCVHQQRRSSLQVRIGHGLIPVPLQQRAAVQPRSAYNGDPASKRAPTTGPVRPPTTATTRSRTHPGYSPGPPRQTLPATISGPTRLVLGADVAGLVVVVAHLPGGAGRDHEVAPPANDAARSDKGGPLRADPPVPGVVATLSGRAACLVDRLPAGPAFPVPSGHQRPAAGRRAGPESGPAHQSAGGSAGQGMVPTAASSAGSSRATWNLIHPPAV